MNNKLYEDKFVTSIKGIDSNIIVQYYFEYGNNIDFNKKVDKIKLIKENFSDMYIKILNTLYFWQEKNETKFEIFDCKTETFSNIYFNSREEIHKYLGPVIITLLENNFDKDNIYIGFEFHIDCLISIEHGISAVFKEIELLCIDATDSQCILDNYFFNLTND